MEQFSIFSLGENHAILNDIVKTSSSRWWALCTLLGIFFFLRWLFLNFYNLERMIFTPKLCIKNIGHRACSRAKDHRTSLAGPLIEKQYRFLGMRACLLAWFPLIFFAQYRIRNAILRNHLNTTDLTTKYRRGYATSLATHSCYLCVTRWSLTSCSLSRTVIFT